MVIANRKSLASEIRQRALNSATTVSLTTFVHLSPFILSSELASWQKLPTISSFNTSSFSGLLVLVSEEIIMVNVLGCIFSVVGVCITIKTSIRNVVPTGFGFIGQMDVCSIMPSEPSSHSLRKVPHITLSTFVHPMVGGTFIVSMCVQRNTGELVLESWEYIV